MAVLCSAQSRLDGSMPSLPSRRCLQRCSQTQRSPRVHAPTQKDSSTFPLETSDQTKDELRMNRQQRDNLPSHRAHDHRNNLWAAIRWLRGLFPALRLRVAPPRRIPLLRQKNLWGHSVRRRRQPWVVQESTTHFSFLHRPTPGDTIPKPRGVNMRARFGMVSRGGELNTAVSA
jgi:hypothetical protein